jgi:hypothetical protein
MNLSRGFHSEMDSEGKRACPEQEIPTCYGNEAEFPQVSCLAPDLKPACLCRTFVSHPKFRATVQLSYISRMDSISSGPDRNFQVRGPIAPDRVLSHSFVDPCSQLADSLIRFKNATIRFDMK